MELLSKRIQKIEESATLAMARKSKTIKVDTRDIISLAFFIIIPIV